MADDRKQQGSNRGDSQTNEEQLRRELRRDPEFEMPDPEQVDRDIEQAEKTYRKDEKGKNVA
jgi:hypothetical protein